MRGLISSARPAAAAGSTRSISATMPTSSDGGRLSSRRCCTPAWSRHRDSGPASGCAGVHVAVPKSAHQQQALDRLLAEHQVDEAERGAPGPLQVIDERTPPAVSARRPRATPPHAARCARTCAVSGSPASGGTASSAANSGTTAVSRPALAPTARRMRSRSRASSSSGSANSSRPNARNA